jgi:hypothetical protein
MPKNKLVIYFLFFVACFFQVSSPVFAGIQKIKNEHDKPSVQFESDSKDSYHLNETLLSAPSVDLINESEEKNTETELKIVPFILLACFYASSNTGFLKEIISNISLPSKYEGAATFLINMDFRI